MRLTKTVNLARENKHIDQDTVFPDEAALINQASEGSQYAYGQLYSHYFPKLYYSISFICKDQAEAEEIVQEAFLRVWDKRDQLFLVRSFEDYVYRVAKNILFDVLRRNKVRQKVMDVIIAENQVLQEHPELQLQYKQYIDTAARAIDQLSDQKKEIFLLRTQSDKTFKEIAELVNLSVAGVKKHFYQAANQVKESLQQNDDLLSVFILLGFFLKK